MKTFKPLQSYRTFLEVVVIDNYPYALFHGREHDERNRVFEEIRLVPFEEEISTQTEGSPKRK